MCGIGLKEPPQSPLAGDASLFLSQAEQNTKEPA